MSHSIRQLGIWGMVAFVLSLTPSWLSILAGISCMILTMVLYAKLDKLAYGTNLFNLNLRQWGIALLPAGAIFYLAYMEFNDDHWFVLLSLITVSLLVFLAIVNYFIAKSLLILAAQLPNNWFYYSGRLTQFAAYTMPILLGFFLLILAQPLFLMGCITAENRQ